MRIEKVNLTSNKGVTMTAYLLDDSTELSNISTRPAMLIFPGGGYYSTSDREAEPIAMAYLAEGYNAYVLRYSVGKETTFTAALSDAEEAITMIRENTKSWNTDPNKIAVIGFSAGGHLAAALGTMGKNRPNALILGYPCILSSLGDVLAFPVPSLEKEVDHQTPPAFLFSTFEDSLVPIENTLCFMMALNRNKIPFESHIFQQGAHGLSLAKPLSSSGLKYFVDKDFAQWFDLSISWLQKVLGDFPADKESLIPDAKDVKEYSTDVTIGSILEQTDCREIIIEYLPAFAQSEMADGAKAYSMKVINQYLPEPLSEDQMKEMDMRLRAIPFNG
ncbi:esterase [Bacillus sp. AFS076308]|uniref:alpha/beta hydrolase n=1 Tax=unclassified Bacillus (in: firmicutes) TaxID=185979 RepID=UPI000BF8A352|nr:MULTISPECIES: alpha/beta hydrolase [unclassified Bacillus (in: firmicutes)]PFO07770.1 esterase [Bacillus sp. AFS076308]PGV51447.1 esterase [Bacillus sp. AFS037270]